MASFADNSAVKDHLQQLASSLSHPTPASFPLTVVSWVGLGQNGTTIKEGVTVQQLSRLEPAALRIVFAPLDEHRPDVLPSLLALLDAYGVPPSFLTERIEAVTYSFGQRQQSAGAELTWFHYLCKNVKFVPAVTSKSAHYSKLKSLSIQKDVPLLQSYADFSWIHASFVLRVQSNEDDSGTGPITLLCFGPSEKLKARFVDLLHDSSCRWQQILQDPLSIYSIVLDELYLKMDAVVWDLGDMFGDIEMRTLNNAKKPTQGARSIDFVGLHNISKQSIYLQESSSSLIEIIDKLISANAKNISLEQYPRTHQLLTYHRSAVHSTLTRLISLDRRINNLIGLSFNLVAQSDSRTLKADSKLMILIALVTIIFLPTNTIAAIFGSPFFQGEFQESSPGSKGDRLQMLAQFWLFWAISIPVTTAILVLGWWYWQNVKQDVLEGTQGTRRKTWGSEP